MSDCACLWALTPRRYYRRPVPMETTFNHLIKTVLKTLFSLSQFKGFVDTSKLKMFYLAHVSLHLTYASTVWGGCNSILFNNRPGMTFAVDWALKKQLSIYLAYSGSLFIPNTPRCRRTLSQQKRKPLHRRSAAKLMPPDPPLTTEAGLPQL